MEKSSEHNLWKLMKKFNLYTRAQIKNLQFTNETLENSLDYVNRLLVFFIHKYVGILLESREAMIRSENVTSVSRK